MAIGDEYLVPGEQTTPTPNFRGRTTMLPDSVTPDSLVETVIMMHDMGKSCTGIYDDKATYRITKWGAVNRSGVEIMPGRVFERTAEDIVREGFLPDSCADYGLVLRTHLIGKGIPASILGAVKKSKTGVDSHTFVKVYLGEIVIVDPHPHDPEKPEEIVPERVLGAEDIGSYFAAEAKDFWGMGIKSVEDFYRFVKKHLGVDHPELRSHF